MRCSNVDNIFKQCSQKSITLVIIDHQKLKVFIVMLNFQNMLNVTNYELCEKVFCVYMKRDVKSIRDTNVTMVIHVQQ